jgi:hypothetical protein
MKKLIVLNSFAIFIFLLLFLNIDNIASFSVNWVALFMLVPIAAGLITVLKQKKDKSCDNFITVLAGSIFFSFVSIFFYKLILYFFSNPSIPFSISTSPLYQGGPDLAVILLVMYLLGGLLGIAAKGVNHIFFPKHKFRMNFNIPFLISFLIGAIILLGTNVYYVLASVPPDGRWKFELPATSLFIILYLAIFFFVSKKLIKNPKTNNFLWVYNTFLSLVFLGEAKAVEMYFQNESWPYWHYLSTAPYLVILGFGLICYIPIALYLEKIKTKFIN